MKVAISGLRNGRPWPGIGEVVELPDSTGADMCAAGMADPVAEKPREKAEKAVAPDAEMEEREDQEPLTTETAAPVKRGPGRPRKRPAQ